MTLAERLMKYIWVVFPAIIVLWGGYWAMVATTSDTWVVSGQFGDMFGAFTALVSGLAFAGIIIAILLQRQDLELQREELRLQRQELARSAEAQEEQNDSILLTAKLNSHAALLVYYSYSTEQFTTELQRDSFASSKHAEELEKIIQRLGEEAEAEQLEG